MSTISRVLPAKRLVAALVMGGVAPLPSAASADNPIVQTIYTADPAPLSYNGRVYQIPAWPRTPADAPIVCSEPGSPREIT